MNKFVWSKVNLDANDRVRGVRMIEFVTTGTSRGKRAVLQLVATA